LERSPSDGVYAQHAASDFYRTNPTNSSNMNTAVVSNVGGSRSHSNLMPFLCINFIIALFGIYPSRH
ncbi:MAG: phage tail protein, partial [Acidobacteriota bacterium]